MIRYYFIGLAVLIIAIFANYIAGVFQWKTWYDFLQQATKDEPLWSSLKIMDLLWLFILYPLLLGLGGSLGELLYQNFFKQ